MTGEHDGKACGSGKCKRSAEYAPRAHCLYRGTQAGLEQQPGLPITEPEPWEASGLMAQIPKLSVAALAPERGSAERGDRNAATQQQRSRLLRPWFLSMGTVTWALKEWETGFH